MSLNHLGHYSSPLPPRSAGGYKPSEPPRPQRRIAPPPSLPRFPWPFSLAPRKWRPWLAALTAATIAAAAAAVVAAGACRSHELCRVDTPLYLITQVARFVLPANPLHFDIVKMRNFTSSSRPAKDFSKHNVTVQHAVAQPGHVKLRIYAPATKGGTTQAATTLRPVVLWFHGGGWVVGDGHDDRQCVNLVHHAAGGAGAVVISVEYRLAPEHPFPAAVADAAAALRWARSHARAHGGDSGRIVLAGESAGGNVAAAAALANYDSRHTSLLGRTRLAGLWLLYPCLDYGHVYPSYLQYGSRDYPLLSLQYLLFYWSHYLGKDIRRTSLDYRAVPMRAPHRLLARLPPTSIVLAKFDVLLDEGRAFHALLRRARGLDEGQRGPDTLTVYNDTVHGFSFLSTEERLAEVVRNLRLHP